jgi:hypothetical protein
MLSTTNECMDLSARRSVAPYVAGTLPELETDAFEAHLITCEWCQSEVRLATVVRAEMADVSVPGRARTGIRRLVTAGGLVAAAAAVVLFVVGPDRASSDRAEHRAVADSPVSPVPLHPIGPVEEVSEARWTGLIGARSYRVTLVDSDGVLMWEKETADTFVVVPPTVVLEVDHEYFWKVEAQMALDRWKGSDFERFQVMTEPRPTQ